MAPILSRLDVEEDVEGEVVEIQKHDKVGDKDEVAGRGKEETQCQCKNNSTNYTQSIIYCNLIYGNNKSVILTKITIQLQYIIYSLVGRIIRRGSIFDFDFKS